MQARPASAAAGVAMARRSQLEGRLLAILDGRTARGKQGRAATVAAVVAAVAMMSTIVAAVRAQSQAEQNAPEVESTIVAANAQKNHEILDQAAVSYEQLRKYAEAQKLRQASLEMAERLSGQQSQDYAIALVKLGNLARRRSAYQEATDYYNTALVLGDRPEAFSALMNLGRDAFRGTVSGAEGHRVTLNSDPGKALEFLKRARNVADNGNDTGTALTWMARVRQSETDGAAEAESLYRRAVAAADANSAEQALALEFYAQFLKAQDRAAEAGPIEARSAGIRKTRVSAMGPREAAPLSIYKVGGGVKAPSLVSKVEPEYSEEARSAKYSGTAVLKVVVDVDGLAKNIEVVNALGMGLDEQAVLAIQRWKFKPGEKDGVPVPVMAKIEVNFKLM
jgi:TonB family protein